MGVFRKHIPCPKCGSKDNRAMYDDGSEWCFGCHDYSSPTRRVVQTEEKPKTCMDIELVDEIPEPNLSWLRQYLTDEQIETNFQWSPKHRRHVYVEYTYRDDHDCDGEVTYWEARKVFNKGESTTGISKVISSGPKPYSLRGKWKETETVVIVEDIVSAIKLMDLVGVLCLHGTAVPWPLYQRLGNMPNIKRILVWLDADKFGLAQGIASKFQSWNKETAVIRTLDDPKSIPLLDISRILKDAV